MEGTKTVSCRSTSDQICCKMLNYAIVHQPLERESGRLVHQNCGSPSPLKGSRSDSASDPTSNPMTYPTSGRSQLNFLSFLLFSLGPICLARQVFSTASMQVLIFRLVHIQESQIEVAVSLISIPSTGPDVNYQHCTPKTFHHLTFN